jgi:hypothetical protein
MTDISITAGSVVKGANAIVETGHAGETVTAGQAIYLDTSTMLYMKADSNAATAAARQVRGIALNGASANQPLAIQKAGDITIGATLTGGTTYYLSDSPGGICPLADVGSGEYFCIIGIAKSSSMMSLSFNYSAVSG